VAPDIQYHPDTLSIWAAAERRRLKKREKTSTANNTDVNYDDLILSKRVTKEYNFYWAPRYRFSLATFISDIAFYLN